MALRMNQPANILISDLQPRELGDSTLLLPKSPAWRHFVLAALVEYTEPMFPSDTAQTRR